MEYFKIKLRADNTLEQRYREYRTVPRISDKLSMEGRKFEVIEVWLINKDQSEDYAAEIHLMELS